MNSDGVAVATDWILTHPIKVSTSLDALTRDRHLLRAPGRIVGDSDGGASVTCHCGFELDADGAIRARSQGGAAGMSLREVSRGGSGDGDACDRECCRPNVGERDELGSGGGANRDGAEVQTGRGELGGGADTLEWYQLRAARGTVGHAEGCAACTDD